MIPFVGSRSRPGCGSVKIDGETVPLSPEGIARAAEKHEQLGSKLAESLDTEVPPSEHSG